jgi:hypothetical protein
VGVVHNQRWSWREPAYGEHFRRCSWCGSMNPEDLAVEPTTVKWADRKYGWPHKFYVDIPNRDPDRLYCVGSAHGPGADTEPGYIPYADLTVTQREAVKLTGSRLDRRAGYMFGTKNAHHAKFYTAHLADATIPAKTRDRIERMCGLRFEFTDDGKVGWRSVQ